MTKAKSLLAIFLTTMLLFLNDSEMFAQSQYDEYFWTYQNQILELNAMTGSVRVFYQHVLSPDHIVLDMTYDEINDVVYVIEAFGNKNTTLDGLYQTQLVRVDRQTYEGQVIVDSNQLFKLILSPTGDKAALISVTFYQFGDHSLRSQFHICMLDLQTLQCKRVENVHPTADGFVWITNNELLTWSLDDSDNLIKIYADTLKVDHLGLPMGFRMIEEWSSRSQLDDGVVLLAENIPELDLENPEKMNSQGSFFIFNVPSLEVETLVPVKTDLTYIRSLSLSHDGIYFMIETSSEYIIFNTLSGESMFTILRDDYYLARWSEYSNHIWLFNFSESTELSESITILDLATYNIHLITNGNLQ